MVRTRYNQGWFRRGLALVWDPQALLNLVTPDKVVSLRQFFEIKSAWPEVLPAGDGDALAVAGLEGCLDVLTSEDAAHWAETDLRDAILSFQDHYQGGAGLLFWLPSGRNKLSMRPASEQYFWKQLGGTEDGIPLGRLLFSGAESEVERILDTDDQTDIDGKHWVGLHHPRIS